MLALITGDPVPQTRQERGGFEQLIQGVARGGAPWQVFDLRGDSPPPDLEQLAGIVVSGSPERLGDRAPWMLRGLEYLRNAVQREVPTLGICFGHQMLAAALGGRVGDNPRGREMGTVRFEAGVPDPVLGEAGSCLVNASHLDSVLELPEGARALGCSDLEPHAAVRFAARAWGVQFHPEFDAEVMRHYVDARAQALLEEGFDLAVVREQLSDTPEAAGLVERFVAEARR